MNGEVFARFYSHTNSYRKLLTAGTEKLAGSSQREALLLVAQSRVNSPEIMHTNNRILNRWVLFIYLHIHITRMVKIINKKSL